MSWQSSREGRGRRGVVEGLSERPARDAAVAAERHNVLEVKDLHAHFRSSRGDIPVVRGVSFELPESSSIGLVGESGSGKSITALSIMRLLSRPGYIAQGEVVLNGRDILQLSEKDMNAVRGREMGIVFQEPMAALNPVYPVGKQVAEAIRAHQNVTKAEAMRQVERLFELVGITNPGRVLQEYPHHLSGGMCQRVTIASALANEPNVLILDEPTTALDATIQAQVLDVVRELQERTRAAIVMVTHDIGVVSELCQEIVVMYGGKVMEIGPVDTVIDHPHHPYTVGLIEAALSVGGGTGRLRTIPGEVMDPQHAPPGCPFAPRCPQAMEKCNVMPELKTLDSGRRVACWLY
jgi:oligopeptide/dipeptide ABC transporter ATP-binding protein